MQYEIDFAEAVINEREELIDRINNLVGELFVVNQNESPVYFFQYSNRINGIIIDFLLERYPNELEKILLTVNRKFVILTLGREVLNETP